MVVNWIGASPNSWIVVVWFLEILCWFILLKWIFICLIECLIYWFLVWKIPNIKWEYLLYINIYIYMISILKNEEQYWFRLILVLDDDLKWYIEWNHVIMPRLCLIDDFGLMNTWICPWKLAAQIVYDMLMKSHKAIFKWFRLILVNIDEMSGYMHEIGDYNLWYHEINDYHV